MGNMCDKPGQKLNVLPLTLAELLKKNIEPQRKHMIQYLTIAQQSNHKKEQRYYLCPLLTHTRTLTILSICI